MAEPEQFFGYPVVAGDPKAVAFGEAAVKRDRLKVALISRFIELLRKARKTNPGVTWIVDQWGGIRGRHPEFEGRVSPLGFVVWSITGEWPAIGDEITELDKHGFESVSLALSVACEEFVDEAAARGSLRQRILNQTG